MIDTHAHISSQYYDNIDDLMKDSAELKLIINSGSNVKNSYESLSVSNKYKNMVTSVGIHPTEEGEVEKIEQLLPNKKIVAIGEIGLDYYHQPVDKIHQQKLFISQMELAKKYDLPVIIHSRNAEQDTYEILKKYPEVKGIIHCFTGSIEIARKYVSLNYKLGIGGVVTFKNSKLSEVVKKIEVDHLVVETDAPFLSPEPLRGKTNYPVNVKYIYEKIAQIKNQDLNQLVSKIEDNIREIIDF